MVLKLIQPYTRIRIPFVSAQLNVPEHDVEQLLVALILDNRIAGHIDQARRTILSTAAQTPAPYSSPEIASSKPSSGA